MTQERDATGHAAAPVVPEPDMSTPQRLATVIVARGEEARALLGDEQFLSEWRALLLESPHATAFQAPHFVTTWYSVYGQTYEPVLVVARDGDRRMRALLCLAYGARPPRLVHAGASQAEYHVWISRDDDAPEFVARACEALRDTLGRMDLVLRYVPSLALAEAVATRLQGHVPVRVIGHTRPLVRLDPEEIRESRSKKSNKSRVNRLKRLGRLEFRALHTTEELDRVFDRIIEQYDFRQGAVNGTSPFHEDVHKRAFHRELYAVAPAATNLTVTSIDGQPIAALWASISRDMVHLGILAYSPLLAAHSPGKLHILDLCTELLNDVKTVLDLTPGGDPWKERFANSHDEVAELHLHRSWAAHRRTRAREALLALGKAAASKVGVTPGALRATARGVRKATPSRLVRSLGRWISERHEFRVYRGTREWAAQFQRDPEVRRNDLSDLLLFRPGESWQTRQGFLGAALERLEN